MTDDQNQNIDVEIGIRMKNGSPGFVHDVPGGAETSAGGAIGLADARRARGKGVNEPIVIRVAVGPEVRRLGYEYPSPVYSAISLVQQTKGQPTPPPVFTEAAWESLDGKFGTPEFHDRDNISNVDIVFVDKGNPGDYYYAIKLTNTQGKADIVLDPKITNGGLG